MPHIVRKAVYRGMTFHVVADVNDPVQSRWNKYLDANAKVNKTEPNTAERTQAENVRNSYANAFVRNCVFYDPESDAVYEGSKATDNRVFRPCKDGSPRNLYVGIMGGDVKDTMYFQMTIGADGTMTLSNEPLRFGAYPFKLKDYLYTKNPTLPGRDLKEYVERNYEVSPHLANLLTYYGEDPAVEAGEIKEEDIKPEDVEYQDLAFRTDPDSALRVAWNKFRDADRLFKDPNSEYVKNHTPEEATQIRKSYDEQRRQLFNEFIAYAEFIEPSTGRVIPKNEAVWTNSDLNGTDPEQLRDPGAPGFRSEKGYLLVRDPNSDPADGQVFVFKRDGGSYTLDSTPFPVQKYPAGYAKYIQSKSDMAPYDLFSKIAENSYDLHGNSRRADRGNRLSDSTVEAAGEFFNGIGSLENNPTFVEENEPVIVNYIEENEPLIVNYIEENAPVMSNTIQINPPLISNFIEEAKPLIVNYIEENEPVIMKPEMTSFLDHRLDAEPVQPAVAVKFTYDELAKKLGEVDRSLFPSGRFTEMVKAFKEVKGADKEHPGIKNEKFNDLVESAARYIAYKDPNGDQAGLSDYEKSRVEFVQALLDFAKAGASNSHGEMQEMMDTDILMDFCKECKRRTYVQETAAQKAKFFADGVEAISKISARYPDDSKMHVMCKQVLSGGVATDLQKKMLELAGIQGPVNPENVSKLPFLKDFGKQYKALGDKAAAVEQQMIRAAAGKKAAAEKARAAAAYTERFNQLEKQVDAADRSAFGSEKFTNMVTAFKNLREIDKAGNNIEKQARFNLLATAAERYLDYKMPEGRDVKLSKYEQSRVDVAKALVDFGKRGVRAAQEAEQARAQRSGAALRQDGQPRQALPVDAPMLK